MRFCEKFLHSALIITLNYSYVYGLTPGQTKLGTWEKGYLSYWVILDINIRTSPANDDKFVSDLKAEIRPFLLPPKDHAIYEIKTPALGLLSLVIDTPGNVNSDAGIRAACQKFASLHKIKRVIPASVVPSRVGTWDRISPLLAAHRVRTSNTIGPTPTGTSLGRAIKRQVVDEVAEGQDPNIRSQTNALDSSILLSLPPGVTWDQMWRISWNWKNAGEGVTVFSLDSGCDKRHPEFKNTKFRDWLYPGPDTLDEPRDEFTHIIDTKLPSLDSFGSHGTAVTAKIVGEKTGVAQNAEVVIVGDTTGSSRGVDSIGHRQYMYLDALTKIHDYVEKHRIYGKCIINIASGWWQQYYDVLENYEEFTQIYGDLISHLFKRLTIRYSCYLVLAAGNGKPNVSPDSYFYAIDDLNPNQISCSRL
ncbi:hypothetical protein H072_7317 [Dactylellina haptotyla CBS 200.50]|uniref:Peptidase S8/S53 domain-containing protein n=1 Tax=Dactylellina haptotyla (strain CBS 200.50) TaxID=1284197 RepID=S8A7W3_DACHA|nr:hypothetical protein H072_7317 [Dactylellina haptotyla CBS 200.50]